MGATYKAVGINLKSMPLGESDRLLTILTRDHGLIRVVAPGARKHKSSLRGRSSIFVVNELVIAKGRSLDRITQADGIEYFSGLSQNLSKLTASQYLAELTLTQALSQQPQAELFALLCRHLRRFETYPQPQTLACLIQGIFHLLITAGLAPQVQVCCLTQHPLEPDFTDENWRVGFSPAAGGAVSLSALEYLRQGQSQNRVRPVMSVPHVRENQVEPEPESNNAIAVFQYAEVERIRLHPSDSGTYPNRNSRSEPRPVEKVPELCLLLNAPELDLLQRLASAHLMMSGDRPCLPMLVSEVDSFPETLRPDRVWLSVERILRHYAQYHLEKPIRSAALIDACFLPLTTPS